MLEYFVRATAESTYISDIQEPTLYSLAATFV